MSLSTVEKLARAIHEQVKRGMETAVAMTRYENLLRQHFEHRADILSWRADSWIWVNELQLAVDDLFEAISVRTGARLASDLCSLSRVQLRMHQFKAAEPVLLRLADVERHIGSTYFLEYARLLRAYCLAKIGRAQEALYELDGLDPDAEECWIENLPRITPELVRQTVACSN